MRGARVDAPGKKVEKRGLESYWGGSAKNGGKRGRIPPTSGIKVKSKSI